MLPKKIIKSKNLITRITSSRFESINNYELTNSGTTVIVGQKTFHTKKSVKPFVAVAEDDAKKVTSALISNKVNRLNEDELLKMPNVTKITVEEGSASYVIIEGSLYQLGLSGKPKKLVKFITEDASLQEIALPEGVTEMNPKAFEKTGIKKILLYSPSNNVTFYSLMASKAKSMGLETEIINKQRYDEMITTGKSLFGNKSFKALDGTIVTDQNNTSTILFNYATMGGNSTNSGELAKLTDEQKAAVKIIRIGSNVKNIPDHILTAFKGVESFGVSTDNPTYTTLKGNLYTKDGQLVRYAVGKPDTEIALPKETTSVRSAAFKDSNVKKAYLYCDINSKMADNVFAMVPDIKKVGVEACILTPTDYEKKEHELEGPTATPKP